jgi:predicted amidohydrolase YtcJ
MHHKRLITKMLCALLASLCLATVTFAAEDVDLLIHNARIATIDPDFSMVSTMAIRGDRIVALGGDDVAQQFNARQRLDLNGQFVMPGFIDTHTHLSGNPPWYIDLTRVRSIVEITSLVREKAASLPKGHWITGYGWSEDVLAEQRRPLRDDLDDAAPNNPVGLTRAGGHSAVFNSTALSAGKIDETTAQPDSGTIEKGDNGRLNGIIRERHEILLDLAPVATDDIVRSSFINNLRDLFKLGITSIVQAADAIDHYPEWQRIYAEHRGTLPRAAVQVRWEGTQRMAAFGSKTGDGDEHLRLGAIKVFADGGFTGPAAFTKKPYQGMGDYRGSLTMSEAELLRTFEEAHRAGWQLGVHAIGDAAIELVVLQLAQVLRDSPRADHRHYLNHFTIRPSDETMRLMTANHIGITQQPNFTWTLEGRYAAYLGEDELRANNPLRSPMSHGVFVALSSDILPLGPMVGIRAAVTRKGMTGKVYGENEKLSIQEALTGYTRLGAWLTFEDTLKGSLEPGKLADFIVLGEDPLVSDPDKLMDVPINQTWLGGKQVWKK